ncbi:MAG: hypothetical protein ABI702_16445 [Burkholderiales bacterium]
MGTWHQIFGEDELREAAQRARLVVHISGAARSAGQPCIELFPKEGVPADRPLLGTFKSCAEAVAWIEGAYR